MAFVLRLGSRPSKLALAQAELIKNALTARATYLRVEIVPIRTAGDRLNLQGPLKSPGNKRLFVDELERALSAGRVDLNVHSMKDLPAALGSRFRIVAVPKREDPRDALVFRNALSRRDGAGVEALPAGATVGTSSVRRMFEALRARSDLRVIPIRGNVDTRLGRLESGELDGVILALAGLKRLGRAEMHRLAPLNEESFVPAAGQGALALEAVSERPVGGSCELDALVRSLNDDAAAAETAAERAFLAELGASCSSPVGVRARMSGAALAIHALLFSHDGGKAMEDMTISKAPMREGIEPATLGRELAHRMLEAGGRSLLADG
jgi:hydroxymethylbilane synthase